MGMEISFIPLAFACDSGGNQLSVATSGPGTGQPSVTLTSSYDPNTTGSLWRQPHQCRTDHVLLRCRVSADPDSGIIRRRKRPGYLPGYDSGGRLTSISRTVGTSTSVNTSYTYDAANRVVTITDQAGGTALATYVYGYDNANRVTTEVNAEGTVTYAYDSGGELLSANGSRTESYSYDSGGNRTMTGYTTGTGNELTASPGYSYTYDGEGNMTGETQTSTGDVWTYGYDNRNRMVSAVEKSSGGTTLEQVTYTYDAQNNRIGEDVNGTQTWTVYDGRNPYADFNGSGTLQERYLYGKAVDEILARTSSGGTTAWYLTDRLGSVRDIVNTSGAVIDHIVYDSYGNVTSETNASNGDRFKYTGREYDAVTGLYYYRARYYSPWVGRFTQRDPMGFAARDPNLYRYASDGPPNATDPTGTDTSGIVTSVGVGMVGGAWAGMVLTQIIVPIPGSGAIGLVAGAIGGGIYGLMFGSGA